MTVIEDPVQLFLADDGVRALALAAIFKARSTAPPVPACTQEEHDNRLHAIRQLGLNIGATSINWTTLEPTQHERSAKTKMWATWPRSTVLSMDSLFEEPLFLADIDPQQKDELVTFVTQAVNNHYGLTSESMLDVSTKYGVSTWQALEVAGWMSRQNTASKKAAQLVEEWGAQAPYVLPREGGRGRLALTYMSSFAIASMLGDTGASLLP